MKKNVKATKKAVKSNDLAAYVSKFSTHIGTAIEAIDNAAKVYAEALNKYGEEAQAAFCDAYPHVTPNTWEKFRAVGNGDANPNILLFSDKFAKKVMRMPRHVQDDVLNGNSFEVFNTTTRKVEHVTYSEISPRVEKILFDDTRSCIRTIPEQVAYSKVMESERKFANRPYRVHSDHLEVMRACSIGRGELENIMEEMS